MSSLPQPLAAALNQMPMPSASPLAGAVPTTPPGCALCGGPMRAERIRSAFLYWHCQPCGLRMLAAESQGDRAAIFAARYFEHGDGSGYHDYEAEAHSHRRNADARLDQLAAAGVRGGALLEVGTAAGFLLEQAKARGFAVTGVDISPWSRERTGRRTGATLYERLADVPRPPQGFQAIVMAQVLEHMPDAPAALQRATALLQPGGVLLIEDWDASSSRARRLGHRWQEFAPPSVVWLFGRAALGQLLQRAGLQVERIDTPGKRVGVGTVLHKLLGGGRLARVVVGAARACGVGRLSIPYLGNDLITVLARAPARP